MEKTGQFIARLLLAQIFLIAGISKISGYAGIQGYMDAMGVSGSLLPLVILLEIGGAIAIIVGWQTRRAAIALAIFSLIAAVIFHHNFADQTQMIMFMSDCAISGGLLLLAVHGAGAYSLDNRNT